MIRFDKLSDHPVKQQKTSKTSVPEENSDSKSLRLWQIPDAEDLIKNAVSTIINPKSDTYMNAYGRILALWSILQKGTPEFILVKRLAEYNPNNSVDTRTIMQGHLSTLYRLSQDNPYTVKPNDIDLLVAEFNNIFTFIRTTATTEEFATLKKFVSLFNNSHSDIRKRYGFTSNNVLGKV